MPITYGSVGDVIATFQIAVQLFTALNETRGSAREFQDLVKSLSTFNELLEQLVVIWPTRAESPVLETLYETSLPIVRECREEITTFLDTIISKYGKSLARRDGPRNKLKDMGKMLQWHIFESGAIAKLQQKLDNSSSMIKLAYMCAQGVAEEKDQAIVSQKLDFVNSRQSEIEEELEKRLDKIQDEIVHQRRLLEGLPEEFRGIISALTPIANTSLEIKAISNEMSQMIQTIYQLHLVQPRISQPLDPYKEMSITLEDALGYSLRIPLETIRSWTVVKQVLIDNFSDRKGGELVRAGRYILQDSVTGGDLSWTIPFDRATRPGQKIVMSMFFYCGEGKEKANTCPRCGTVTLSSGDQDINCSNPVCDVTFRRVTDESESTNDIVSHNSETDLSLWKMGLDDLLDEDQIEDCHLEKNILKSMLSKRRADDSPDIFKRVRLFTRWQDSAESRGSLLVDLGGIYLWNFSVRTQDIRKQLMDSIQGHVERPENSVSIFRDCGDEVTAIGWKGFFGKTLQHSYPLLLIYSKNNRVRQRTVRLCQRLPWVDQSGIVVASCSGPWWREDILDWASRCEPDEMEYYKRAL